MTQLTGKWTLKASFNKVPIRGRRPQRVFIQGSLQHDGYHPLKEGMSVQLVEGDRFTVTPQSLNPKSREWEASTEHDEMSFEPSSGIVVNVFAKYSNGTPNAKFNDVTIRCIPHDKTLQSPIKDIKLPNLSIPLVFMEAVPVCCPAKDGSARQINISTGFARWVDGNLVLAKQVAAPDPAWANKPTARWIKYFVDPPAPSSDEDTTVEPAYVYSLAIQVPSDCGTPISVALNGVAYGDNNVTIALDGVPLISTPANSAYGFRDPYGVTFSASLSGNHVLSATVHNISGPTGLLVDASLTVHM